MIKFIHRLRFPLTFLVSLLIFLTAVPSPILAATLTESYTDTSKINTGASSYYQVTSGQLKMVSAASGKVGFWKMDEASGTAVADSSGNGNNGTWYGIGTGGTITTYSEPTNQAIGGVITYSGGYTIHTFTTSGAFTARTSGNVDYLVVAGGGAGGAGSANNNGGGGGAGGMLTGTTSVTPQAYTVTVGDGGIGSAGVGGNGGNSVFGSITAIGGGGGGTTGNGVGGGSGGGAGGLGTQRYGGAGTAGQGYGGGNTTLATWAAGAGGGAGSAASQETPGVGVSSSIRGSSVTYAAGARGGGQGGTSGGANTGNGGMGQNGANNGVSGGSGIVVIRYPTSGTSTQYTVHTFTTSGTFTANASGNVDYLVVAGGGAGGHGSANNNGGGGGAGGMLTGTTSVTPQAYTVTVGDGGIGSAGVGGNGGNSVFGSITAIGGGGGGTTGNGVGGGSGGGAGGVGTQGYGGAGTAGQGYSGGNTTTATWSAGGGGGAGGAASQQTPGAGSLMSSISSGSSVTYAAGAWGGSLGGINGGANTGNGGMGKNGAYNGDPGGSGIVVIRYPTSSGATGIVAGKYSNARTFNGVGNYIDIPNSATFDSTQYTIEGWVYSTNYSQNGFIFEKGPVNTQYSLFFESGNIVQRSYNSAGVNCINQSTSLATAGISNSNWYHIASVYNGTNIILYVNGVQKSSVPVTCTLRTGQTGERIGAYGGGSPSYFFNGIIDDIRVYPTALSQAQIALDSDNSTAATSSTIVSTNLLNGQYAGTIKSITYNLSAKPAGTTATIQFSQNASSWYNATGSLNGTTALTTGSNNTIDITALNWSGPNFYYKVAFGSDGTGTPVLDDLSVNYFGGLVAITTNSSNTPVTSDSYFVGVIDGNNPATRVIDGVDTGTGATNTGVITIGVVGQLPATLAVNANETIVAGSFSIVNGSIALAEGAVLKPGGRLFASDHDQDGYPAVINKLFVYTKGAALPSVDLTRRKSLVSLSTVDCNDYAYSLTNICTGDIGVACTADVQCTATTCGTDADGDGLLASGVHTGHCFAGGTPYTDANDSQYCPNSSYDPPGTCAKCVNGAYAYQTSSEDLFGECTSGTCATGNCNGSSYACQSSGTYSCQTCYDQCCAGSAHCDHTNCAGGCAGGCAANVSDPACINYSTSNGFCTCWYVVNYNECNPHSCNCGCY